MIDLRTDSVSPISESMWRAMQAAPVAWNRDGDSTVERLEAETARLLGKESGLFVMSGTMANLLALLGHTNPGEAFVADSNAHVVISELGGFSRYGLLRCVATENSRGQLTVESVWGTISRAPMGHEQGVRLVWLENTHSSAGGTVAHPDQVRQICALAREHSVAVHMDGARLLNAATAQDQSPSEIAEPVDSVSLSFNKALAAPAGAVLCGSASFISTARGHLQGLGGFIHHAGPLAAACIEGLEANRNRIDKDHGLAMTLAKELSLVRNLTTSVPETNILLTEGMIGSDQLVKRLQALGVLVLPRDARSVRVVIHSGICFSDIERICDAFTLASR